jgi:hypothetical protein
MTFLNYCRELSVALERAMLTETSAQ